MTNDRWRDLIGRIHAAPRQAVVVVTGGGASAISELLAVPGGSRTLLEAVVPYSAAALTDWLKRRPEHFCVEETALAMAAVAYERAQALARAEQSQPGGVAPAESESPSTCGLVGLGCTASLVSDRPKKGEHRCHVAVQSSNATEAYTLVLEKGARARPAEEELVGRVILLALARACGLDNLPALELGSGEQLMTETAIADKLLVELLDGERKLVWSLPAPGSQSAKSGKPAASMSDVAESEAGHQMAALHAELPFPHCAPTGLVCGAFHPLHLGHEQLRATAERLLGGPVYYELSLINVDKPPLDFLSLERRRQQFTQHPLALTAAPTFAEKAVALPGVTFVVGIDTAERIAEPRYYGNSDAAMRSGLARLRDAGCRFLVAGRMLAGRFHTLDDAKVPAEFAALFAEIPATEFRVDVSSTQLRRESRM